MPAELLPVIEQRRLAAPCVAPQALAWHHGAMWLGSRDQRRIYNVEPATWRVVEEQEAPGIPWAAVSIGDALRFTLGEGEEDDRYMWTYVPGEGFSDRESVACPEFTGSYLSFDGRHVYLSQWYKQRILQLDNASNILRAIDVGGEICGHTFVGDMLYVLRGTEAGDEDWRIARLNVSEDKPRVEDLAAVPFQCRSLTHDGQSFWSNHRSANETVAFALPA